MANVILSFAIIALPASSRKFALGAEGFAERSATRSPPEMVTALTRLVALKELQ
jgi:hypothetical protein